MRFTQQSVSALSLPSGKPYHIEWDEALPGFGVRINPTNKVWVVQYRVAGRSKRQTIGRADTIPLDEARKNAKAILGKVHNGLDPHAEQAEAKARARVTFEAVAGRYLTNARTRLKPRSYEELERNITKQWAALYGLPIHKIERALTLQLRSTLISESLRHHDSEI